MSDGVNGGEVTFLTASEQEFIADRGFEQASRVLISQAAARLALELGLGSDAGTTLVDSFRQRALPEGEEALDSAQELTDAIDTLREVLARRGSIVLRAVELAEVAEPSVEIPDTAQAVETDATYEQPSEEKEVTDEIHELPYAQEPIKLSNRAQRYVQTIFGKFDELNLHEGDKHTLARTFMELRGEPKRGRHFSDLTTELLLMFEGLTDGEIANHSGRKAPSVATAFSQLMKRIQSQPGFSYEAARAALQARQSIVSTPYSEKSIEQVDEELVVVEQDSSSDALAAPQKGESKQSLRTGHLKGAIRRYLRKQGHDHMIDLGDEQLSALIEQVFVSDQTISPLRDEYLSYLATGEKQLGNSALRDCIATMDQRIAEILVSPSNILPITTPVRHHRPNISPANMPKKHSVLPFVAPRSKGGQVSWTEKEDVMRAEVVNAAEVLHMSPLIDAAYNEATMTQSVWYKTAYEEINVAAKKLELTEAEASGLWTVVHSDSKDKEREQPSKAAKEALKKLEQRMIDHSERLSQHPEVKSCLRKLVNSFSPQDLKGIQAALQKEIPDIYEGAAQRYVVAGIAELTRD